MTGGRAGINTEHSEVRTVMAPGGFDGKDWMKEEMGRRNMFTIDWVGWICRVFHSALYEVCTLRFVHQVLGCYY